jgi:hypothetical protein
MPALRQVEIEDLLSLNEPIGSIKKELMHLQTLKLESRKLKRESEVVGILQSKGYVVV